MSQYPTRNIVVGKRFGRLTVIVRLPREEWGGNYRRWLCRCDCGTEVKVHAVALNAGKTSSCGCLRNELTSARMSTHGATGSPEFRVWGGIKARCLNPADMHYPDYGGRGIKVCDRWRDSFEDFLADMGTRPSPQHSIDRRDNDGDYCPENCRWATKRQQGRNRRGNRLLTLGGKTMTLVEWCEATGIGRCCIQQRLRRGWTVEDALSKPVNNENIK